MPTAPAVAVEPPRRDEAAVLLALVPSWFTRGKPLLFAALAGLGLTVAFRRGTLTDAQRRELAERIIDAGRVAFAALAARLVAGEVTQTAWGRTMADAVPVRHAAATMALLADDEPDRSDRAAFLPLAAAQVGYLKRFGAEIRAAGARATGDALVNRAGLYADSAWATAHRVELDARQRQGYARARRITEPGARHCRDCPALAALGWVPIRAFTPIGHTRCGPRCRCTVLYR